MSTPEYFTQTHYVDPEDGSVVVNVERKIRHGVETKIIGMAVSARNVAAAFAAANDSVVKAKQADSIVIRRVSDAPVITYRIGTPRGDLEQSGLERVDLLVTGWIADRRHLFSDETLKFNVEHAQKDLDARMESAFVAYLTRGEVRGNVRHWFFSVYQGGAPLLEKRLQTFHVGFFPKNVANALFPGRKLSVTESGMGSFTVYAAERTPAPTPVPAEEQPQPEYLARADEIAEYVSKNLPTEFPRLKGDARDAFIDGVRIGARIALLEGDKQ